MHIEADDAADAVQGSIDALRGMGDWPEHPAELSAHAYVEHYKHTILPITRPSPACLRLERTQ